MWIEFRSSSNWVGKGFAAVYEGKPQAAQDTKRHNLIETAVAGMSHLTLNRPVCLCPVQPSVEGKSPKTRGRSSPPTTRTTTGRPRSVCGGSPYRRDTTSASASKPSRWLTLPCVPVCSCPYECVSPLPPSVSLCMCLFGDVWVKFHACIAAEKLIQVMVCECVWYRGQRAGRCRLVCIMWTVWKCHCALSLGLPLTSEMIEYVLHQEWLHPRVWIGWEGFHQQRNFTLT